MINASPEPSLKGIRILDLTRVWAGPLTTRIFGDYGAEIIKITNIGNKGNMNHVFSCAITIL